MSKTRNRNIIVKNGVQIWGAAFLGLVVVCARDTERNAVLARRLWVVLIFSCASDLPCSARIAACKFGEYFDLARGPARNELCDWRLCVRREIESVSNVETETKATKNGT